MSLNGRRGTLHVRDAAIRPEICTIYEDADYIVHVVRCPFPPPLELFQQRSNHGDADVQICMTPQPTELWQGLTCSQRPVQLQPTYSKYFLRLSTSFAL